MILIKLVYITNFYQKKNSKFPYNVRVAKLFIAVLKFLGDY
jgi:hypothetical protein